jgi:hypothetical protein
MDNEKVIDVETTKNERMEVFKRKAEAVTEIVVGSFEAQLKDPRTFQFAAGIGLYQGLKYRGSLKQGLKAGVAAVGVMASCNAIVNIINNYEDIKKA